MELSTLRESETAVDDYAMCTRINMGGKMVDSDNNRNDVKLYVAWVDYA